MRLCVDLLGGVSTDAMGRASLGLPQGSLQCMALCMHANSGLCHSSSASMLFVQIKSSCRRGVRGSRVPLVAAGLTPLDLCSARLVSIATSFLM